MTDEAKAMGDVERVACAIYGEDTLDGLGEDFRGKALAAATAAIKAMSGWRDIETAPMDDTPVLLAGGRAFCEWRGRHLEGPMIAGWNGSYWLVAGVEGGYVCVSYENPTVWMPLPTPPEGGE